MSQGQALVGEVWVSEQRWALEIIKHPFHFYSIFSNVNFLDHGLVMPFIITLSGSQV